MTNPFEIIAARLENIESLLIDIKCQSPTTTTPTPPDFITIEATAEILSLSVPTVYGLVHKKQIPFYKKRGRLYFKPDEIFSWLADTRRMTTDEIKRATIESLNR